MARDRGRGRGRGSGRIASIVLWWDATQHAQRMVQRPEVRQRYRESRNTVRIRFRATDRVAMAVAVAVTEGSHRDQDTCRAVGVMGWTAITMACDDIYGHLLAMEGV